VNIVVNSDPSLQDAIGILRELYVKHRYVKLAVKTGKDRSISQNSILHVWIEQIAREIRDEDALGHKCYIKLHYGVPIMRAESEEFREAYDQVIKPLPYEKKLIAMRCWPCTSLMSKPQLSKLLEIVQEEYAVRGVMLEFPKDE